MKRITTAKIVPAALIRHVWDPSCGAVATFFGSVRSTHGKKKVIRLDYEAHAPMAEKALRGIEREAIRRFKVKKAIVLHRIGPVKAGEPSVGVAVSSPHREAAFAACQFCINNVKIKAQIWKKEVYPDGARWIQSHHHPARHR